MLRADLLNWAVPSKVYLGWVDVVVLVVDVPLDVDSKVAEVNVTCSNSLSASNRSRKLETASSDGAVPLKVTSPIPESSVVSPVVPEVFLPLAFFDVELLVGRVKPSDVRLTPAGRTPATLDIMLEKSTSLPRASVNWVFNSANWAATRGTSEYFDTSVCAAA